MRNRIDTLAVVALMSLVAACGGRSTIAEAPTPPPPPVATPTDDNGAREAEAARRRAEEEAARRRAEEEARMRAVIAEMIHFDFDRYDIRADARPVLDRKVEVLRSNPAARLRIEGHADERGSDEYNLALGLRRAEAAKQYLVARGLDAGRFEVVSFGEERPLEMGQNEAAWGKNRRSEFHALPRTVTPR